MLRSAPDHPKMMELAGRLKNITPGARLSGAGWRTFAVGLMEIFWQWAGKYCPTGVLGPCAETIANGVAWQGEAEELVQALMEAKGGRKHGFIEKHPTLGYVVHDWSKHADDTARRTLERDGIPFWDGTPPRRKCRDNVETKAPQCRDKSTAKTSLSVSVPEPVPVSAPVEGKRDASTADRSEKEGMKTREEQFGQWVRRFRGVHPDCAAVTEIGVINAIREYQAMDPACDVEEAFRAFERQMDGALHILRPVAEFEKYLRHACPKLARFGRTGELEQKKDAPPRKVYQGDVLKVPLV